ncbi:hypothetical protein BN1723_002406 [Verticillium longisporum]|uniref:Uncharacterized protein n=2 Tax=Verticillium longisporum TaxID=100787 RepID=A0A0G4L5M7_VERLO|nr:hypothetical protein BN1723_002406 [Verticillium longisporum]
MRWCRCGGKAKTGNSFGDMDSWQKRGSFPQMEMDASKGVACATPFLHSDVAHDGPSESKSIGLFLWCRDIPGSYGSLEGALPRMPMSTKSKDRPNMPNTSHLTGWDAPRNGWCPPDRVPNGRSARGMKSSLRPLHLLLPLVVIAHDPARYNTEQDVHVRRVRGWTVSLAGGTCDVGDHQGGRSADYSIKATSPTQQPYGPSRSEEPRLRLDTQGDYAQPLAQAQAGLLARPGRVPISAQPHS